MNIYEQSHCYRAFPRGFYIMPSLISTHPKRASPCVRFFLSPRWSVASGCR